MRTPVKRLVLFQFALCLILFAPGAQAREAIISFDSEVTIEEDASLLVTETITVIAEGNLIKRGIVREFPTAYKDRFGHRFRVAFEIQSVKRNGRSEPFHTKKRSNGVELYTGSADKFLTRGEHRIEITYRTTRQIGYYDDFDELYWNVTGNGWRLPIEFATYTLHLPRHARAINIAAYTGSFGEAGKAFRITDNTEGLVRVVSTRTFREGEGLTVAVSFPQGLIHKPDASEKTDQFLRDNAGIFAGLIGLLVVFAYYLFFWDRHGRDPEGGAIIPRFKPPEGFSPAAARFVYKMSYDRKAFSAAVINMAVKGYLEIDEIGDEYTLKQISASSDMLTKGEQRIASRLFANFDQIVLADDNHKIIAKAISAFETGLKAEYQHEHFANNSNVFVGGIVLTAVAIVASSMLAPSSQTVGLFVLVQGAVAAVAAVATVVALSIAQRKTIPFSVGYSTLIGRIGWSVGLRIGIPILFFAPQLLFGALIGQNTGIAVPLLGLAYGVANGIFYSLLKAPTQLGRSILDEIEGFRLYLSVAEQDRLNALNPPERTPELFEKFLPFALALDVENEWSEQFTDVLAAAGAAGEEYQPRWYHGSRWHHGSAGSFSSDLNSSFSSAIASSAIAPGTTSSSSGGFSSGGGFSGGGGGGGGGGGW